VDIVPDHLALPEIHQQHLAHLADCSFDYNLFANNPLMGAGKEMFKELEQESWETCTNCRERYICVPVGPRSHKCQRCGRNPTFFHPDNDLTHIVTPPCLARLSPVEKSAISIICPTIAIYTSAACKGHCISFFQDVSELAMTLPRLPRDLPFIVIINPNERIQDKMFNVCRANLMEALQFLKENNEDYANIDISEEHSIQYPVDGILQTMPQV
jgi:hypothetical protein